MNLLLSMNHSCACVVCMFHSNVFVDLWSVGHCLDLKTQLILTNLKNLSSCHRTSSTIIFSAGDAITSQIPKKHLENQYSFSPSGTHIPHGV